MDRYPSPFDPTRDSVPRRVAEWIAAGGVSAILALASAEGPGGKLIWWLALLATVGGLAYVLYDESRLRRLDLRAWTTDQWHLLRENEYRRREGVFLTHNLVATRTNDGHRSGSWQVTVQLIQHGAGPLTAGTVKEVEYSFGPQFTEGPVTVQSPQGGFRYSTKLHGSLLVVGRVVFKNPLKRPLIVERYVVVPDSEVARKSRTA